MKETYTKLYLTILEDEERKRHGNYKYLVSSGASSHTAFYSKEGLDYWLQKTGITIGEKIDHLCNTYRLNGTYFKVSILCEDHYYGNNWKDNDDPHLVEIRTKLLDPTYEEYGVTCAVMDNGDWTKGIIEKTPEGNVIYYLNPNEYKRIVYPYQSIKS